MEKLGSTWQVSTENLCARSAFALSRIFSSDGPKEAPSASYRTEKTPHSLHGGIHRKLWYHMGELAKTVQGSPIEV